METVKRNEHQYNIPLKILSYKDLYGWTMDKIVAAIGKRSNCTFCGVFRRQVNIIYCRREVDVPRNCFESDDLEFFLWKRST